MKKLLAVLLIALLAATLLFSCGETPQDDPPKPSDEDPYDPPETDPFAGFAEEMAKAESFEATTVFSSDALSEDFVLTYRKSGAIRYLATSPEETEQYMEDLGNGQTKVVRRAGDEWKTETVADESGENALFSVFFAPDNYEKEKDGYRMKTDVLPEGFAAVALALTKDGCRIACRLVKEDAALDAVITVGKLNEVTLALPSLS